MKIAMIGHKRIPSREGGIEIVVEELAVRMVQAGHQVVCFNRKGHHVSGKEFDSNYRKYYRGVQLKEVLTIDRKGLAAATSSLVAAIASVFERFDVIHFHAEGPCAVLWVPRLFGIRTIATIHGLDHQRAKWAGFARKYLLFGERIAAKYADEIIVLSKNLQKYFKENYGRETIYIPNGVNRVEKRKCDIVKKKWGLVENNYILYLGRIVPEKGLHYLVEAFQKVTTEKKLVIAGGSSDTKDYMQQLKQVSGNNENIIFTDFVQGVELQELYSNAYFYVLPSDLEGMPLSLLEAMSYGCCCLVSDIEECVEVTQDTAITFKHGSVEKLVEKIQFLCDNKEIVEEYGERAYKRILGNFDWNEIVNQTLKIYKGEK